MSTVRWKHHEEDLVRGAVPQKLDCKMAAVAIKDKEPLIPTKACFLLRAAVENLL
jgi:hypothetical protein